MKLRAAPLLVVGVVLAACASNANAPRPTSTAGATSGAPTFAQPTLTPVSITESTYGRVVASTAPGAPCKVEVHVGPPQFGDVPPASVDATADVSGVLAVTYATPALPKQTALTRGAFRRPLRIRCTRLSNRQCASSRRSRPSIA